MKLLRIKQVISDTGRPQTSLYEDIAGGLFVPPIKWGRSSHFPADEVEAIIKARIAGKSDDEIRALVAELVAARKLAA